MNSMKRFVAAALIGCASIVAFSFGGAEAAAPVVPETVYEWVQSSPRMNYFFNKEQIKFAVRDDGSVDINTLVVPVLKTYDPVKIDDVVEKRRWRLEPVDHLSDLAGEADYVTISVASHTVTVSRVELLDSHFSTLERLEPDEKIDLLTLSPQNLDSRFYNGIIAWSGRHGVEIGERTRGTLTHDDKKHLEETEKKLLKADKKAAEEREEAMKREAKEKAKHDKAAKDDKSDKGAKVEHEKNGRTRIVVGEDE